MQDGERGKGEGRRQTHLVLGGTWLFEAWSFFLATSPRVPDEQPIEEPMDAPYMGASDTLVTMCFTYLSPLFTLICIRN